LAKASEEAIAIDRPPSRAWLMGIAAWLVPGLGHALQGRWTRAIILAAAVWVPFLAGFWLGGHLFIVKSDGQSSALYQLPPMIANLGSGLLYIVCWFLDFGFAEDPAKAALATYEYGEKSLLLAGLLNYLVMLDAFDIAAGRKE
jgi:hypothetical protein